MEATNAFIAHPAQPSPGEISTALGPAENLWRQITHWVAEQGAPEAEWKSFSSKYGWSLRMKQKKRTILYLAPCNGCFRVSFILGDKAVEAARQSNLPRNVVKEIEQARHYVEGTGISLIVRQPKDLGPVRNLVQIKMAN
jgi:hypothetical protein